MPAAHPLSAILRLISATDLNDQNSILDFGARYHSLFDTSEMQAFMKSYFENLGQAQKKMIDYNNLGADDTMPVKYYLYKYYLDALPAPVVKQLSAKMQAIYNAFVDAIDKPDYPEATTPIPAEIVGIFNQYQEEKAQPPTPLHEDEEVFIATLQQYNETSVATILKKINAEHILLDQLKYKIQAEINRGHQQSTYGALLSSSLFLLQSPRVKALTAYHTQIDNYQQKLRQLLLNKPRYNKDYPQRLNKYQLILSQQYPLAQEIFATHSNHLLDNPLFKHSLIEKELSNVLGKITTLSQAPGSSRPKNSA